MYPTEGATYGGAREHGRHPTGYRALGFIPSECLVHHQDVGFQWLCGEPVPAEIQPLLESSQVDNPVVSEITPPGTPDPEQPGHYTQDFDPHDTADSRTTPEDPAHPDSIQEAPVKEAGFGILGLVASLLFAAAISRILDG